MYGALQTDMAKEFVDFGDEVVLGDFNSGLGNPAYQPEGLNYLLDNGYESIFKVDPITCCPPSHANFSFCVGQDSFSSDHILIKKNSKVGFYPCRSATFNQFPLMSDHIAVRGEVWKWWFSDNKNSSTGTNTKKTHKH